MTVYIKNIILYDNKGAVAGFIEIRPLATKTHLRLKHSITTKNLFLSLVIDGVNKVLNISGALNEYELQIAVDLNYEIFACIVQQENGQLISMASGAINLNQLSKQKAIKEIDTAMKKICSVDENGQGNCEQCPYRDYFFKQA